jgi:hypothetical protein
MLGFTLLAVNSRDGWNFRPGQPLTRPAHLAHFALPLEKQSVVGKVG